MGKLCLMPFQTSVKALKDTAIKLAMQPLWGRGYGHPYWDCHSVKFLLHIFFNRFIFLDTRDRFSDTWSDDRCWSKDLFIVWPNSPQVVVRSRLKYMYLNT